MRGGGASQVGCLYGLANWANQDHSFLERAEIAVHHKHSSPDHNPDRGCSCCSVLGKESVYTNFLAAIISTPPQGNILSSASSSLCILSQNLPFQSSEDVSSLACSPSPSLWPL